MIIRADKAHTGVYLAGRVLECLRTYGIQKRILGITLDNASNNNTLVSELGDLLHGYQGSLTRIHCFAHILNLVVKVSHYTISVASSNIFIGYPIAV
jgi:hypothetical protein